MRKQFEYLRDFETEGDAMNSDRLNRLGLKGWELVGFHDDLFYFKREIVPEPIIRDCPITFSTGPFLSASEQFVCKKCLRRHDTDVEYCPGCGHYMCEIPNKS